MKLDECSPEFEKLHEAWEAKAKNVKNTDELKEFIEYLLSFEHDFGTIVHATWAAMLGTFSCMDKSPQGGLTGFQVCFLPHKAIREFLRDDPAGHRVIFFSDLLSPWTLSDYFKVSKSSMEKLKELAKDTKPIDEEHAEYLRKIIEGKVPEPFSLKDE